MEEAVEKQLDEVQHAQPVTKTQESISPASRAIAPSPAAPEPVAITKSGEAIASSPAPAVIDSQVSQATRHPQREGVESPEFDREQVSDRVDEALNKLRWSVDEIRDFLVMTYKKRSCQFLTGDELRDFLCYLEAQSPELALLTKAEKSEAQEEAMVATRTAEGIAPSPAPPEPAAVTKPEDSEDVEEAMVATRTAEGIAPSPAPCEKAPLLQKTSVAVTESTHQFEAGDRVHHPVFGYGTLNEIIRTTAFCKFDKVPDSTGRIQRNAMRSLDISELRKVT